MLDFVVTENIRSVVDGTLGLGGHALQILAARPNVEQYAGFDLSLKHLAEAQSRLTEHDARTQFHNQNFSAYGAIYADLPAPRAVLLDLGLCSAHVDDTSRGMSFNADAPLDFRFGETGKTAAEILSELSEEELCSALRTYGDVPYAPFLAESIRTAQPKTTKELCAAIDAITPPHKQKKTYVLVFQALRILTNQEMEHLRKALETFEQLAAPGDTLGVISYHSGEDRIVKRFMRRVTTPTTEATPQNLHAIAKPARFKLNTKKPLIPSAEEQEHNKRSRSAKTRIITCIAQKTT